MVNYFSEGAERIYEILEDDFSDEGLSFKVTQNEVEVGK